MAIRKKARHRSGSVENPQSEDVDHEEQPETLAERLGEGQFDDNEDLLNMEIPERPLETVSHDPNEARLVISRIEVENFKSYFGRKVLGPLHKNYTSILGPNGSGKSNVIDSILFVFGFRANKIRSKKLSVLIHKSAAHPNVSSAEVTVFFERIWDRGPNDYEVKPNSHFSVTRTVNSDGSSRYYFNKKAIKPDELRKRLKENGIDLDHNRFLILQGEVEQISLMKPKGDDKGEEGMLEYLEDIIGSNRLKTPIEKLARRTERLDEQLKTVANRRSLAAKEHTDLIEPLTQLFKILRLENAITKCNNQLYHIEKKRVMDESKKIQDGYNKMKKEHDADLEEKEKLVKEMAIARREVVELQKKENELKEEKESKEEEERKYTHSIQMIESDVQRHEEKVQKLEKTLEKEKKRLVELESGPEKAQKIINDLEGEVEGLKEESQEKEAEYQVKKREANDANDGFRKALQELMPEISEFKDSENKIQRKLTLAEDKVAKLKYELENPQRELEKAQEDLEQAKTELENFNRDVENKIHRRPELEREISQLKEQFGSKKGMEAKLTDEIRKLSHELMQCNQQNEGRNNPTLSALLTEKAKGNFTGVYGRLGDLGGIDEKYDVAISTGCGPLDNIVVDSVETGQQCLEFMKRNRLPNATFIALDKQQNFWSKINAKPTTPEGVSRLFDLVQISDEDVKPAFYYALRETLVAENVDQAARISNFNGRRYRVVTLGGDLIETTGTLSGGGKTQRRGRMGKQAKVDAARRQSFNVRSLEQNLRTKEMELNQLRNALRLMDEGIRTKTDEIDRMGRTVEQDQNTRVNMKRKIQKLTEKVQNSERELSRNDDKSQEVQEWEAEVDKYTEEKARIIQEGEELLKRKNALEEKIRETENRIVGKAKKEYEKAKKEFDKAQNDIKQARLTISNSNSLILKARRGIESIEKEIKDFEYQTERATHRKEKAQEKIALSKTRIEELGLKLSEVAGKITEGLNNTSIFTEKEEELAKRLDERTREMATLEEELCHYNRKMEAIDEKIGKLQTFNVRQNLQHITTDRPQFQLDDTQATESRNDTVTTPSVKDDPDATLTESDRTLTDNNQERPQATSPDSEVEVFQRPSTSRAPSRVRARKNQVKDEPRSPEALNDSTLSTASRKRRSRKTETSETMNESRMVEQEEEAEDLPNTTTITSTDGNTTHDPAYDFGHLPTYSPADINAFDEAHIRNELKRKQRRRERYPKEFNLDLIQEYADKLEKLNSVDAQYNNLKESFDAHRKMFDTLKKMRVTEFQEGFQRICVATEDTYKMLTMGGEAALELVDSMDPFTSGVSYQVRPPKKTWKQITNLSGGEKTLASLALVFGLHSYRPTPFYVMDEIDAALDYRNVSIISTFVKERTKNAQFVIISLRNNMFENGDRLLGIYKVNDCTNNVIYDPDADENEPPAVSTNVSHHSGVAELTESTEQLHVEEGPPSKRRRGVKHEQS
ncbi:unnamed protein product [Bursaphelenchus xylophilus]|uniref:Structural maintenance of chromosomes protein n=1 Tax=Bursaphelenchus xylophilus TaxID=6326 RepID=A0A1I7SME9_BURXY|nr:unnamed protein product [Bursaphelenchus xylophilus]CAG9130160.1 unnamed protein product [Bursaphelenchus xylophilus]